jgi:hypothetical protein
MYISRPICRWIFAVSVVLIGGCVVIPIPALQDSVVSGRSVAESEVRSMVSHGEDAGNVRTRLGSPTIDFGPRRVYVYHWAVNKGAIVWLLGGNWGAIGGIEPLAETNLLLIAFDTQGKVLNAGTVGFHPFDTIGQHLRDWLSSVGLTSQVIGPRPGQSMSHRSLLFVYRRSTSPCSFPTFDANIFKPSIAVDDIVVGDLAKGEYLSVELEANVSHAITIDPYPDYRIGGQESSFFVQDVQTNRVPVTVNGLGDPNHPIYVETYLCTGNGKTVMHAKLQDAESALIAIRELQPAW